MASFTVVGQLLTQLANGLVCRQL